MLHYLIHLLIRQIELKVTMEGVHCLTRQKLRNTFVFVDLFNLGQLHQPKFNHRKLSLFGPFFEDNLIQFTSPSFPISNQCLIRVLKSWINYQHNIISC